MSIPNWEMDNLIQPELFSGKWTEDPRVAGLYCQPIRINPVEKGLAEQERRLCKCVAATLVQTFEEKLTEAIC